MVRKLFIASILSIVCSTNSFAVDYLVENGKVSSFKVTTVTQVFNVESPTSRVEFLDTDGESLKLTVMYDGKSDSVVALANGQVVEQFGIKLRSVDTCNLVYVMRVVNGIPRIAISYKQNEGMTTHAQCGDKGYVVIKNIPLPEIKPGTRIILEAYFRANNILTVKENDKVIWSGEVGFNKQGLSGFRSDNVKINFSIN